MIMSRTKETLDQVAREISKELLFCSISTAFKYLILKIWTNTESALKGPIFGLFPGGTTGREVKVIVTDFVKEDVFGEIEDQLRELDVGILGWMTTKLNI